MNPTDSLTVPVTPGAPEKLGKFKASRMIVKESWQILKQDREILWFPVVSAISSLIALVVMVAIFFFVAMKGNIHAFDDMGREGLDVMGYVILFVYYLVMFVITNYFLAGMYIIIHARFGGQNLSFSEGLRGASENMGRIFAWSLISATVGVILRIIADKSAIIGKIVASLLGAAWNILTYFSLPALIIGKTSIKDSFKVSAGIIRRTWGETIIINFGVSLFFMLIVLIMTALAVGLVVIVPFVEMLISVSILWLISMIVLSIVSSTLGSIFKLALYEYANTGTVPQGFTPALIQGAVSAKK